MRRVAAAAAAVAGLLLPATAVAGPSTAAPRWAPAATAQIHPGVQLYTRGGGQCTANFVFTDKRARVYLGYAAHCAGLGEATDTDGCLAKSLPLRTPVRLVDGGGPASEGTTVGRGRLAYSSWLTMQKLGTADPAACAFNDFALVRVGAKHAGKVNPSIPFWGGPVGLNRGGTAAGDRVYSFGSSSLRGGLTVLSPKTGLSLGTEAPGWSHPVYTLSPGIPGDSGSGFLDAQGRAVGVLSTLAIAPLPGSNGVGDLRRELAFAREHSGIHGLRLVNGTEPFDPVL